MNNEQLHQLINRYNRDEADRTDLAAIESLLEQGTISLEELGDMDAFISKIEKLPSPSPSLKLDDKFYDLLANEKRATKRFSWEWLRLSPAPLRWALASLTFFIGLALGYAMFGTKSPAQQDMTALSNEVKSLKEMMMLSLLEKESATDRLKAVSMTEELETTSGTITDALFKTLNMDENVNVRLAALDALRPYVDNSDIRKRLIESIGKQKSPLVQIALADLMASIQEKSAVKEFDKLLKDNETPKEVKTKIRKSIEVLI